jgi:hypothetical protein
MPMNSSQKALTHILMGELLKTFLLFNKTRKTFHHFSESKVFSSLRRQTGDGSCRAVRVRGFVVRFLSLSVKRHKKFISSHNDDHKMVNRGARHVSEKEAKLCAMLLRLIIIYGILRGIHSINNKACTRRMCLSYLSCQGFPCALLHCDSRSDSTRK